jgi:divalent metal cation (Fe/Co/Zn/Cd) transporter
MPMVDWGIAAITLSGIVNLAVSVRVARVAKKCNSSALAAEAVHLRGDLWACTGVLIGLVATHLFNEARLDPIFAAGMTLVTFANAPFDARRCETARGLQFGRRRRNANFDVLQQDRRVLGYHKLRTRQAGILKLADVHVLLMTSCPSKKRTMSLKKSKTLSARRFQS